jgi:non-ribosomal peptide synthetase-like protein
VTPADVVFQGFSPASDGHVEEVFPTLLAGATLAIGTTQEAHSGQDLHRFLHRHRVTIISCSPTLLSMVEEDVPTLRRILFGAESCPPTMVNRWWTPDRQILNTYGPTEATVGATFAECLPDQPITIGRPLPNYHCFAVDDHMQPVALGEEGELVISGIGLSPGYFGREELNEGRFVDNPLAAEHPGEFSEKMYRTGDLVRQDPHGNWVWLGRIDAQVKIRGHRVELSDVESHLLHGPIVQSAVAVVVDGQLVAHLRLRDGGSLDLRRYIAELRSSLPGYMVPVVLTEVDEIPTLPSGKIDRIKAATLSGRRLQIEREIVPPQTDLERLVLSLWQALFPGAEISCTDDFFRDLGGFSLVASKFISTLRSDHGFPGISVTEIYENPTVRSLAAVLALQTARTSSELPFAKICERRYRKAKAVQGLGILVLYGIKGVFWIGPTISAIYFSNAGVSDVVSVALGLCLHVASIPLMLGLAIAVKWGVGGKFEAGSSPLWGTEFLRWWFVHRMLAMSPHGYLTGTPFAAMYLRALGAKVGANVHLESLEFDAPDLITIGDDVILENGAWLHPSEVVAGELVLRPIQIERGATVGVRSGLAGGSTLGEGASLRDLTCISDGMTVPAGEEWAGSPARRAERTEMPAYDRASQVSRTRRHRFALAQFLLMLVLPLLDSLPFMTVAFTMYSNAEGFMEYAWEPLYAIALVLFACIQIALVKWVVLGRLKPGTYDFPSGLWLRKWFADKHLELVSGLIVPVYDSLFARPWCIAMGMKCGPRCEIALPRRMPYDLVKMGEESFLASEVSIGRPIRRNGKLFLENTIVGRRSFLGNDSVVPQGSKVPDDFLLGVLSVFPHEDDLGVDPRQAWLGSPPFRMPQRHVIEGFDVRRTYRPTRALYAERLAHEAVRIVLPSICFLIIASVLMESFTWVWNEWSLQWALVTLPLSYGVAAFLGATMCVLSKIVLIGRYKPTITPLWSRFVWKTETNAAVLHDFGVPLFFMPILGTPYMTGLMRYLGAKIGQRAFINTTDWTETDLISLGDDVAVNANAPLQCHLFEDRVMKVGAIRIGERASVGNYTVVLCDSEIRHDARIGHLSLVMKGETIPAHTVWMGSPAQAAHATKNDAIAVLV